MKKNVLQLTLAALFLLCSNLYGQKVTIGAKGGISIPNLTGGGTQNPLNEGYSSRLGADGGIYGEYHLNNEFSISVGLEYSSQGGLKDKFQAFPTPPEMAPFFAPGSQPFIYANFKSEAKMDYLLVPVLARYTWKMGKKSPFKIYAAVGPFAGFLLSANQVVSGGNSAVFIDADGKYPMAIPPLNTPLSLPFDTTTNIKSELYTFNVGVNGFLGISYSLNKQSTLFIEGGGNYGFLSIQRGSANGKNNTGAGVVTVGYAYTFKNKYGKRRR